MAVQDPEHPAPEEPKHVACAVCLKEIPESAAETLEGAEYVYHFCGIECMDQWRTQKGELPDSGDKGVE